MRIVDLRGQNFSAQQVRQVIPRAELDISKAADQVKAIIEGVRREGVEAVVEAARLFDGIDPTPIRIAEADIREAVANLAPTLRTAIEQSIDRVRRVSHASKPLGFVVPLGDGAQVEQRWQPVDAVGLYVPGGRAVYPSSVIMNTVPAQVAGVKRIVIATPGQKDFGGRPHPTVLATAGLLGVSEVLVIGGPTAIASFAYGLSEIDFEPVDLVTGPGNIFVAAAKRLLRGEIGIDSEAGTTEIMILADNSANPKLIAHDLVSQAEHDEAAASVLVTDSEELISLVQIELEKVIAQTSHRARVEKALSGNQSALVLVEDLENGVAVANAYATEHLELMTSANETVLANVSNAGAIFLGDYSPVSLGDYMAGSNHVLPTGSTARFSAGLGVTTFMRPQQIINYQPAGLAEVAGFIREFSDAEGLPAHGDAVIARFED